MDNFANVMLGLMMCCLIAIAVTRPSTRLFVQKHPLIAVVWLTTVLAITTAMSLRIRSALDVTGTFLFIGFLMVSGAAIVEIEQQWNTPKRIVTLLLGASVIAFVCMVVLGAFI